MQWSGVSMASPQSLKMLGISFIPTFPQCFILAEPGRPWCPFQVHSISLVVLRVTQLTALFGHGGCFGGGAIAEMKVETRMRTTVLESLCDKRQAVPTANNII
jgi:hypothetical protein